jgi:hypothetical protein
MGGAVGAGVDAGSAACRDRGASGRHRLPPPPSIAIVGVVVFVILAPSSLTVAIGFAIGAVLSIAGFTA